MTYKNETLLIDNGIGISIMHFSGMVLVRGPVILLFVIIILFGYFAICYRAVGASGP